MVCLVTSTLVASPPPPPFFSGAFGQSDMPSFNAPSVSEPSVDAPDTERTSPFEEPRVTEPKSFLPEPSIEERPEESFSRRLSEPTENFSDRPSDDQPTDESASMPAPETPSFGDENRSSEEPSNRESLHRESFGSEENSGYHYPSRQIGASGIDDQQKSYDSYQGQDTGDMQQTEEVLEQQDTIIQQGIDDFNVEGSGNWLLKRVWWEKTEEVYQEIKGVFNQVLETRMQFIATRNKLDRELDIFYGEMGLEQGPLNDIVTHILDLMEKMRKAQGDVLSSKEEDLVKRTQEKEQVLVQLKLDIKAIQEVEDKLDQALNTLFKQIDVCNEYEQRAWNNFKDIARELNDKEARKSYYQTLALFEDVKKIQAYLTGAFSSYFQQTVQSAREHAQTITAHMQNLRNQGIDLQKEALILENDRDNPNKDVHKKKEEKKKEDTTKKQNVGFFGRVAEFFRSIFSWIGGWFGTQETRVKKADKKVKAALEKDLAAAEHNAKANTQAAVKKVDALKNDVEQDYEAGRADAAFSGF